MKLNRTQKIMLLFGVLAVILISGYHPPQEAIAVLDTTFIVETSTGQRIGAARLDCYQHDWLGGIGATPSFTIYSDSSGIAHRIIAQGIFTVKAIATGYAEYVEVIDMRVSNEVNPSRTYPIVMQPDSWTPPPGTVPVDIYLVDPQQHRVSAYIDVDGATTYLSDGHGYAVIYVTPGSHSLRIRGYYQKDTSLGGAQVTFDFTVSITAPSSTPYTAYVATGSIVQQSPPDETGGGGLDDLWGWLNSYTYISNIKIPNYIFVAAAFLLLVMGRR